ncbi:Endochitinase 1 [Ceratocystis lukuohia]|uniref:chitinase n=1 Tax=Ceratocystis lukuohia TaxID=2019550 RepID=A0ABR4MT14_9PEZI
MVRVSLLASVLAAWVATAVAAPAEGASVVASSEPSSSDGAGGSDAARYILYFDKWHTSILPNKTMTAGITHVIMAFAEPLAFTTDPIGEYEPHMELDKVREMFDENVKISMAIGGWGFTVGFSEGVRSPETRALYAKNIADTVKRLGYDGVDIVIDWEYPGGHGADSKQVPINPSEAEAYPLLLAEIKKAIGDKELSVAVPGLERDMMAYTAENVHSINAVVDYVNVMTYDLLNRRDTVSGHHSGIKNSLAAIDTYIERGFPASKLNLGIRFYAKYFTLKDPKSCTQAIGCPLVLAERHDGTDAGTSGFLTFEPSSFLTVVDTSMLTLSTDNTCGMDKGYTCGNRCCSRWGFCGTYESFCGVGCQPNYGRCHPVTVGAKALAESFKEAFENGHEDVENGGQWYVDPKTSLFWTWDTPALVERKFTEIIAARGLGGIMAWSLAEDSYDWRLLAAMQKGVRTMGLVSSA